MKTVLTFLLGALTLTGSPASPGERAKDYVSGEEIAKEKAAATALYKDVTFYFKDASDKATFEAAPDTYFAKMSADAPAIEKAALVHYFAIRKNLASDTLNDVPIHARALLLSLTTLSKLEPKAAGPPFQEKRAAGAEAATTLCMAACGVDPQAAGYGEGCTKGSCAPCSSPDPKSAAASTPDKMKAVRSAFRSLSEAFLEALDTPGGASRKDAVVFHCSMANASWLQPLGEEKAIGNPYYGAAMLRCGVRVQ